MKTEQTAMDEIDLIRAEGDNGLNKEEREAAAESLTHIPALRHHLREAITQCVLFDRVMVNAQHRGLDPMNADKLAEIRLGVDTARHQLEELEDELGIAEKWLEISR